MKPLLSYLIAWCNFNLYPVANPGFYFGGINLITWT